MKIGQSVTLNWFLFSEPLNRGRREDRRDDEGSKRRTALDLLYNVSKINVFVAF